METRQVITPQAPAPATLPTFGGERDANRFIAATPHFDAKYRRIAANSSYAGTKFDIAVPTSLCDRQVYCDLACESGVADVGWCLGDVKFYAGGQPVLILPFNFMPGAGGAVAQAIGFHVTSGAVATTPGNTLGLDVGTAGRLFVPPWQIKIACSKIEVELRAGLSNATDACYVILGCLSQGREEA
jgi:hypothetical protein